MEELKFDELQNVNGGKKHSWDKTPYKCMGAVILGTAAAGLASGFNPVVTAGGYVASSAYCAPDR